MEGHPEPSWRRKVGLVAGDLPSTRRGGHLTPRPPAGEVPISAPSPKRTLTLET